MFPPYLSVVVSTFQKETTNYQENLFAVFVKTTGFPVDGFTTGVGIPVSVLIT